MKLDIKIEPRIIASLKHIVSKDETRYVLTGINLRCLDGKATFTATNGRSLASIQAQDITIPDDLNIILPAHVAKGEGLVQIDTDERKITYYESGRETTLRLIDAVYPNFLAVIPSKEEIGKPVTFGIHYLEAIIAAAKDYAKKSKLNDDNGLYCLPQDTGPSIFALEGCPEWFAMLMPRKTEPTIPNWLKKK